MMTSKIPKSCLDDIQRQFIWGETENVRKFHAVRWSCVTMPKELGGLGMRRLDEMNKACLLKLGWKFNRGDNDFWCEVLRGKYGLVRLNLETNARPTDSSLWKGLTSLKNHLLQNTY
jgi:hypothetical protein